MKAFPSASVLRVLVEEGLGCDVVGAGELRIALAAGADPAKIVMHGNAKSDDDISAALQARIGYIAVDGPDDIDRISRLAAEPAPVLLRTSPGIDSATHAALATGGASKFGIPAGQVPDAVARLAAEPMTDLRGLHAHIGSQILDLAQFEAEVAALARLGEFGVYDLGGGLGVRYEPGDAAPGIADYAEALTAAARRHLGGGIEILVEPGRSMTAPVGPHPVPGGDPQGHRAAACRRGRRHGRQPGVLPVRAALRPARGRPVGRRAGPGRPGRPALRRGRRHHARRACWPTRRSATWSPSR